MKKKIREMEEAKVEEACNMAAEVIGACRILMTRPFPYFSKAIFTLKSVESFDLPTMGVDKYWRLYYNPEFTCKLNKSEILGVLLHELYHMLRNHASRCGNRNHKLWNYAADMEINDDVEGVFEVPGKNQRVEFKLPDNDELMRPVRASSYDFEEGLFAEEYYEKLIDKMDEEDITIHGVNCDCEEKGEDCPSEGQQWGGSIADGESREWEDGKGAGDEELPGMTESEKELIKRACAQEAKDFASKNPGNMPAGVLRWADIVVGPSKTDWRKILLSQIKRVFSSLRGKADYSYSRMSRRQLPGRSVNRPIFPGMVKPEINVACVVDTSGSISDKDLAYMMAEIDKVMKSCDVPRVRVVSCDSTVHSDTTVENLKDLKYDIKGGGGTDMGLALSYLSKKRKGNPVPSAVIVLTDGYTPWHKYAPPFNVVVAIIGDYTHKEVPDYAKMVVIDPEEVQRKHQDKPF
jgi:predicted metal-dependent peptidase